MVERPTMNRKVGGSNPLILANLGGGGRLSAVSIFLLLLTKEKIMYEDLSEIQLQKAHKPDLVWKRDRNDKYRAWGHTNSKATMTIRIMYEIVEVNCDPDRDW